jgi:hypothetical protein
MEAQNACTEAKTIFEGRNDENTAFIRTISLRCDTTVDIIIIVPDNKREPPYALVGSKRRGKADGIVIYSRQSDKWTTSVWDVNLDDTFPLRGIHADGKLEPTGYVHRSDSRKPLPRNGRQCF